MENVARMHRLGLYLKSKDRRLSRTIANNSVITNSKQLKQKKNADFYNNNYGDRNWNFVKLINKFLQNRKNYENFRILPSMQSRSESSSRRRTLFWNYQAEYKNCKILWIVWAVAVEIPTLPVNQCHSHLILNLKGCFLSERRDSKKGRQAFGIHMFLRESFLHTHMHLPQQLVFKNWINEIRQLKNRSIRPQ